MSGVARLRAWLSAHPTTSDAMFALLLFLLVLGPFVGGSGDQPREVGWTAFLLVAPLSCACLVFRRRYPWRVWLATTALGLVGVGLSEGPTSLYLPAIAALYSLSVRVGAAQAAWAAVVSALVPIVLIVATGPVGPLDPVAYVMAGWSGVALMSGIAVRSQRAVLEAAHERARQAEETREEVAQRRVTEERLRIARELHDVLAHHVSVINVQAGVAAHLVRSDPDAAAEALAHVREASQTVLREVPTLLGLLRTGDQELDTTPVPGLVDAEGLVEQARRSGMQVVWQTTGNPVHLPPGTDLTAYRVLQEALTNAGRHGIGRVLLRVEYGEADISLEIRNAQASPSPGLPPGRHGLIGMRERVTAAGGTLTVGPDEHGTWLVHAVLPVSLQGTEVGGVGLR